MVDGDLDALTAATVFEAAGLSWTMSSEAVAYDGINYGVWYDDVQFARVAVKHAAAAKKLGMPLEFEFRRIHEVGGRPNYYWKARPVEDDAPLTISRLGGDEFAILLPGATADEAEVIAERVRQTVCGTTGDGTDSLIQIPVRISMGVAEHEHGKSLPSLLRAADAALYRAKNAGRNVVSN